MEESSPGLVGRFLAVVVVAAVLCGAGALAVLGGVFSRSVVSAAVEQPLTPVEIAALVPRGAYLAAAADCAACHTAPGGAPFAGGLAFQMPYGTLYATNITPDPDTGIGQWTRADFHRALRDGVGRGGRLLYPAMPYTSYRALTEADVDAIYAYFTTRAPMRVANRADSFPFPYVRSAMAFWNLINLPGPGFVAHASKPDAWNRGRYLVDALGHCGECHTPRDITMGMMTSHYLSGSVLEGIDVPDITPTGLARLGFAPADLAGFMRDGFGRQGVMNFSMYDVVHNSTRHLTPEDAGAMATYLAGAPVPPAVTPANPSGATGQLYAEVCAGCHGPNGEGIPHVAPPMRTNATMRLPTPHNLLVAILDGFPEHPFPKGEYFQPMPGFAAMLTDGQIADLANTLRAAYGGMPGDATTATVASLRAGER